MSRYNSFLLALCSITLLSFAACDERKNSLPLTEFQAVVRLSGLSSCMDETTDLSSASRDDQLNVTVERGIVSFTHSGARFNCCLDSVSLQNSQDGNVIRLVEIPHTADPCRCECSFVVQGEVLNLPEGNYCLEVAPSASAELSLCTADFRVE